MRKTLPALLAALTLAVLFASCPMPQGNEEARPPDHSRLSSLVVTYTLGGVPQTASLTPEFSPGTTNYSTTITAAASSIRVTATAGASLTATSGGASQSGTGTVTLDLGGTADSVTILVTAPDQQTRTYTIGITRTFNAIDIQASTTVPVFYGVPATLRAVGMHCVVYVETSRIGSVSEALAQSIAAEFDANIYGKIRNAFGTELDVDANGVVTLLLLDIRDGFTGTGGFVAGYFFGDDMQPRTNRPHSNVADMLYMDINPLVPGSAEFHTTLAHEFQHLINHSRTFMVDGRAQHLWINEGLSTAAEFIYAGDQVQSHIDWFNNDPVSTIAEGNNFFVWNGFWENTFPDSVLDNYATVYLFFQWLRIHASNGIGIYSQILDSTFRDFQAVTSAAGNRIDSQFNTWGTLLGTWMGANLLDWPTGFNGYSGVISVQASGFANSGGVPVLLAPGEGIFSQTPSGTYTPPAGSGTNIRYCGFTLDTGVVDTTSPFSGDVALVFNANSNNGGADERGFVANVALGGLNPSVLGSLASSSYRPPARYAVGVSFGPGGTFHPDSHRPASGRNAFARPYSAEDRRAWSRR